MLQRSQTRSSSLRMTPVGRGAPGHGRNCRKPHFDSRSHRHEPRRTGSSPWNKSVSARAPAPRSLRLVAQTRPSFAWFICTHRKDRRRQRPWAQTQPRRANGGRTARDSEPSVTVTQRATTKRPRAVLRNRTAKRRQSIWS